MNMKLLYLLFLPILLINLGCEKECISTFTYKDGCRNVSWGKTMTDACEQNDTLWELTFYKNDVVRIQWNCNSSDGVYGRWHSIDDGRVYVEYYINQKCRDIFNYHWLECNESFIIENGRFEGIYR